MGAKQSQEMKKAQRLVVERGMTQYAAAKAAGVTAGAISKSAWYRAHVAATAAPAKRKARAK